MKRVGQLWMSINTDAKPGKNNNGLGFKASASEMFADSPLNTMGTALGTLAAYLDGKLTGNKALADMAMQGLQDNRAKNIEVFGLLMSMGRMPGKAPATSATTTNLSKAAPVTDKSYQTYTKTNPKTGEVYTGRCSGDCTALENIAKRDANHHMNDKGFQPAALDKSSKNADAIRGREQQQIDANGGAKSTGGTSGNAINGISDRNPKGQSYRDAASKEFP